MTNNYLEERKRIIKLVNLVNKSLTEFSGNSNMFQQCKLEIIDDLERFKNHKEWLERLNNRTDISDDLRWELECLVDTMQLCFVLIGKDVIND